MGNSMHLQDDPPMLLSATTFSMLVMGMVPLLMEGPMVVWQGMTYSFLRLTLLLLLM